MQAGKPDLQFFNAGSFVICTPETDAGRQWIFDNLLPGETPGVEEAVGDCLWPVYIERRYLAPIVEGARADGLTCHG